MNACMHEANTMTREDAERILCATGHPEPECLVQTALWVLANTPLRGEEP